MFLEKLDQGLKQAFQIVSGTVGMAMGEPAGVIADLAGVGYDQAKAAIAPAKKGGCTNG
jgi:hypothetical protein